MAWFGPDFNRFFKELAAHNNKEWFDGQRKRYEENVKEPFAAFVGELIARVGALDKRVRITPQEAIFRIHRDVRFSKDKAPYKLACSAIISAAGRKDHGVPGMYIELGPEKVAIYGGSYQPEKEALLAIRQRIAAKPAVFRSLYTAKPFAERFGSILGERNKVLPPELRKAAEREPLLYNKQFYWCAELPASRITSPKLADVMMEHYSAMRPLNEFLLGKV